jgi:hypothetical protein
MKKNDITLIVSVVIISAILALLVSSTIISKLVATNQQVTIVSTIDTTFKPPSGEYLNSSSIDPTILTTIGNNTNATPFAP